MKPSLSPRNIKTRNALRKSPRHIRDRSASDTRGGGKSQGERGTHPFEFFSPRANQVTGKIIIFSIFCDIPGQILGTII